MSDRYEVNAVGNWEKERGVSEILYAVFDRKKGKLVSKAMPYAKACTERDKLLE